MFDMILLHISLLPTLDLTMSLFMMQILSDLPLLMSPENKIIITERWCIFSCIFDIGNRYFEKLLLIPMITCTVIGFYQSHGLLKFD